MLGVAAHVALDLMLAGEAKQIAGRLPKVLAAAHLALPASAVDSMEQVVGAFGVWKERTDLGQTDAYLRRQRRGSRINRLAG